MRSWRRIVGHDRSWSQFDPLMAIMASISRQISLDFRLKKTHDRAAIGPRSRHDRATITPRSGHDRAAIGPRSGHDRGPGHSSIALTSNGGDSTTYALQSLLDRAAIAARSSRDRGVLPPLLHADRSIFKWLEGHDRSIA